MRRVLAHKLPPNGIGLTEAHTSKKKLSSPFGLDAHKPSAYAFAVKTLDPHQPLTRLMCNELGIPLLGEGTPNQGKGGVEKRRSKVHLSVGSVVGVSTNGACAMLFPPLPPSVLFEFGLTPSSFLIPSAGPRPILSPLSQLAPVATI